MNTINNKRRKDSVEKIEKVFLELILDKDIDQISVSDICKKANLNRTTFYSNYVDIYDLVDKIRQRMINVFLNVYEKEATQKKHSYDFSKLFNHIKQNQTFYKTYFKLKFDLLDDNFLLDKGEGIKFFDSEINVQYHVAFFKAGLNAVIKKWLENGCIESPYEIEEIIKSEYEKRTDFYIN